jgi:hypothetical protein
LESGLPRGFDPYLDCNEEVAMLVREGGQGEGKAKVWYTGFALSDLAVSGSLPMKWQLAFYRFSPSPYSVAT